MSFSSFVEIPRIDYTFADGKTKYACLGAVNVDLSGLSVNEVKLVKHLLDVVDLINPVFVDLFNHHTTVVLDVLNQLISSSHISALESQLLKNYRIIILLQNGTHSLDPRMNLHLGISENRLKELLSLVNVSIDVQNQIIPYFQTNIALSDRCEYYPPEITEDELKALGEKGKQVNTLIIKNKKKPICDCSHRALLSRNIRKNY